MPARRARSAAAQTVVGIAGLWVLSDLSFYYGLPALGIPADYNAAPIANSLLYLFWTGVAVILFWPVYRTWTRLSRWPFLASRWSGLALWVLGFAGATWVAARGLPALPPVAWPADWGVPPAIVLAGPAYFLPKSLDILFQQALIVALVLSLAGLGLSRGRIAVATALLFGAVHLLLIFGDMPVLGVLRFSLFAAAFGLIEPWLILGLPNGIGLSYALHWSYYAATLAMLRLAGPGAALDLLGLMR